MNSALQPGILQIRLYSRPGIIIVLGYPRCVLPVMHNGGNGVSTHTTQEHERKCVQPFPSLGRNAPNEIATQTIPDRLHNYFVPTPNWHQSVQYVAEIQAIQGRPRNFVRVGSILHHNAPHEVVIRKVQAP